MSMSNLYGLTAQSVLIFRVKKNAHDGELTNPIFFFL